jgi:Flp pilus assembly protein TadB
VRCACAPTSFDCGMMMATLTRIIEQLSILLVVMGIPTAAATMYALILLYLLVTALIVGFLFFILVRRHQRKNKENRFSS